MLIAVAVALAVWSGPVKEMNEAAVREALAADVTTEQYTLSDRPYVVVLTPFFRVASTGGEARKEYRELQPSQVPADDVAPYFSVLVWDTGNDVQHVVLFRDGRPIQPTSKDAVRGRSGGQAMDAKFPIAELQAGSDVVIVLESGGEKRVPITQQFLDRIR